MTYAGFEEGMRDMRPGGKRRIIIPPELGPPVSYIGLRQDLIFFSFFMLLLSCFRLLSVCVSSMFLEAFNQPPPLLLTLCLGIHC